MNRSKNAPLTAGKIKLIRQFLEFYLAGKIKLKDISDKLGVSNSEVRREYDKFMSELLNKK